MLRTLRIRNLVIIEDLTVEFGPGLNLLTGETGAGKSIVVDALGLVSGARGDRSLVRAGAEAATIEALFEIGDREDIRGWARERGAVDLDEGAILVRRELPASGSSRVWLNGSPSTVGLLRELGELLLDLHGQHEQHGLLVTERQLGLLDEFGGHEEDLGAVADACRGLRESQRNLEDLDARLAGVAVRAEELERLVGEIEALRPRPGELEELDRQRRVLRSAGQVAELVEEIVSATCEGEPCSAGLASRASRAARALAAVDASIADLAGRLEAASLELQDIGSAFCDYRERGGFDPERLEEIESRRVAIERLCLRHGRDECGLLALRDRASEELRSQKSLAGERGRVEAELRVGSERYLDAADRLSARRRTAAGTLAEAVQRQLGSLALGSAVFGVQLGLARGPVVGGADRPRPLALAGADRVEFFLAANPGEPPRPLGQVASGGERSRVALALHVVADDVSGGRALIFDEIDAGVSGAVADAVGARLGRLARSSQVLCVTHLPQIAAYADRHYRVTKSVANGRTLTMVSELSAEERVEELARMLGGRKPTETSRRHANELLSAAGRTTRIEPRSRA